MKIWRRLRYNVEGEKQIGEYLDYFGLDIVCMLSFNFNKKTARCQGNRDQWKETDRSDTVINN